MGVLTIEGIVDNGQIKIISDVQLPEHTKVYIVVPDMKIEQTVNLFSPRLKNPEQATEFEMEVIEDSSDASL
jgi:predicted DNA-binding antitoxin AbrB/MazE fold protein